MGQMSRPLLVAVRHHIELDATARLAENPWPMGVFITLLLAAQSSAPADGNGADLITLLVGLAGGLIGSTLSLLGVHLANRSQLRRDRENDLRKLRDDRRQRLRSDYIVLLAAARAMADIKLPRRPGSEGRPVEQEDLQQLRRQLAKAAEGLAVARIRLLLEEDGHEVLAALDQVEQTTQDLNSFLNEPSEGEVDLDDDDWPEILSQELRELEIRVDAASSSVEQLEGIARKQLQQLEKPVGGPS